VASLSFFDVNLDKILTSFLVFIELPLVTKRLFHFGARIFQIYSVSCYIWNIIGDESEPVWDRTTQKRITCFGRRKSGAQVPLAPTILVIVFTGKYFTNYNL